MQVQIKEKSWVAYFAAAKLKADKVAIVFGSTIHLHNTSREEFLKDKNWICHELKHVEQYLQHGYIGFIIKYLFEWIKKGYYNNKFEVEARQSENEISLLQKANCAVIHSNSKSNSSSIACCTANFPAELLFITASNTIFLSSVYFSSFLYRLEI
jgi:hypothetical protein